jgi:thioredoxin-related protein
MNFKQASVVMAVFFIVLSLLNSQPVKGQSIYQQEMLRINADNNSISMIETLTHYQGKPLLASFFMPNCRWCQRQHKVLKKLQNTCPSLQTIMLGVQGSKQKLRHELRRKKNTFPAYVANKSIIKAVGAKAPVPMMLIFDNQGQLVFKTIGYAPEEKLKLLLNQNQMNICIGKNINS